MKYVRYLALVSVLILLPLAYAQAEVHFGVGIGVGPVYGGYVAGPPACAYGYYDYYPYACAPYGYYGQSYFVNGVFIGAGPWYHPRAYYGRYYGHDWDRRYYARGYYGRDYDRGYFRGGDDRHYEGHGFVGRDHDGRGFRGGRR